MNMRHWKTTEVALLRPDLTAAQIARKTGRSVDSVRRAAARARVKLAPHRKGWPDQCRDRAIQRFVSGASLSEVSTALGIPRRTVRSWIEAEGLTVPRKTTVYEIDGELMTFTQIRSRVPASVKDSTLEGRLRFYGRRTWAELCEPPSHRPRTYQARPTIRATA